MRPPWQPGARRTGYVTLYSLFFFENEMMRSPSVQVLVSLLARWPLPRRRKRPRCASYADELAVMVEVAEAVRSRVDYLAPPEAPVAGRHLAQLDLVERDNSARLGTLMAACGWPRRSVEGPDAARRALLVAQQRGEDIAFQRQVMRQLELAALDSEASVMHLASASDRLAVRGRAAAALWYPAAPGRRLRLGLLPAGRRGARGGAASGSACRRWTITDAPSTT